MEHVKHSKLLDISTYQSYRRYFHFRVGQYIFVKIFRYVKGFLKNYLVDGPTV